MTFDLRIVRKFDRYVVVRSDAPDLIVRNQLSEDAAALHLRPVIDDRHVGDTDSLCDGRSRTETRQIEQDGLIAVLELCSGRNGTERDEQSQ